MLITTSRVPRQLIFYMQFSLSCVCSFSHWLGGEVSMSTNSIPTTSHRLLVRLNNHSTAQFTLKFWSRRACVRHLWLADEAKLAIIFTYFVRSFFPLHRLLFTHFGDTPEGENCFSSPYFYKSFFSAVFSALYGQHLICQFSE